MNPISYLVYWVTGIPESTARLLLTIILAYGVANKYNALYVRHPKEQTTSSVNDRNLFILGAGILLSFFFNGVYIYHSLLTVLISYGICWYVGETMKQRLVAGALVWLLNAAWLLLGYYFTASDDYDISYTMPQCILCLRLMGFAFDYMDGSSATPAPPTTDTLAKNPQPMSFDVDTPLYTLPTVDQVVAYCFFPGAFIVGPQFSFSLYRRWINNPIYLGKNVTDWSETVKGQQRYMVRCILLAILYLGMQQLVGAAYPSSYLLTSEYQQLPFFTRCWTFWVTGKFVYNKYLGVWLLTEGACVLFGITYDGEDAEGRALFGGLANTLPWKYETATSIDHVIGSFNINTNMWTKYYVFKRLKFMGSKLISQGASLFFLAVWHGFHLNYFITFACEFFYTQCETVLRRRLSPVVGPLVANNEIYAKVADLLAWILCSMTLNYAVVGFDLLQLSKAWTAYKSVYFLGHLAIPLIIVGDKYLPRKYLVTKNKDKKLA